MSRRGANADGARQRRRRCGPRASKGRRGAVHPVRRDSTRQGSAAAIRVRPGPAPFWDLARGTACSAVHCGTILLAAGKPAPRRAQAARAGRSGTYLRDFDGRFQSHSFTPAL